jgi:NAD+ kinase
VVIMPVRRLALVVHPTRAIEGALERILPWATAAGVEVVQVRAPSDGGREIAPPSTVDDGDLVVALGGDGTVLAGLRASAASGAPVLGVACGSLGALSAVDGGHVHGALDRVVAGDWTPRKLPVLSLGADHWAVNDFVAVRRGPGQLVAEVTVGDELYVRIAGDGVIVATALGSSAYSMAAGGPILAGGTDAFVCTPLAMHGGSAAPLVVPADATASIQLHPGFAGYDVEIDGREVHTDTLRFEIALQRDRLTLVAFEAAGRGLTALRLRGLVTDSPRVLARDRRT